jgi:hypothetical protein
VVGKTEVDASLSQFGSARNLAMYDNPKSQFHEDLVESYTQLTEQLRAGPVGMNKGLKAAVQAASALFHFREHLPPTIALTKAQTKALCPEYSLLEDITNVSKHRNLTQGTPTITDPSVFSDFVYLINFEDDLGDFTHTIKQVRARLPSGNHVDVLALVTRVLNFWGSYLHSKGVLSSFMPFAEPVPVEQINVTRAEAAPLAFESIAGGRFPGLGMQILKHDPARGGNYPPPVPLKEVKMRIYKRPPVVLSLTFKNAETGVEETTAYDVSDEEEKEFKALIAPDTKRAFIERIISSRNPVPQEEVSGEDAD